MCSCQGGTDVLRLGMYACGHNDLSFRAREEIKIIAVAASFGGFKAVVELLKELPAYFPVPIIVVQHLASGSIFVELLQERVHHLHIRWATEGDELVGGTVYVGVPDRHVVVSHSGRLSLLKSERVNSVRPAADVLFDSVARHFGRHAMGVVLTGRLYDGAAGAAHMKRSGGWVLAQDELSSECFDMPRSAILTGAVDYVLSLRMLSAAVVTLTLKPGAADLFRVPSKIIREPEVIQAAVRTGSPLQ